MSVVNTNMKVYNVGVKIEREENFTYYGCQFSATALASCVEDAKQMVCAAIDMDSAELIRKFNDFTLSNNVTPGALQFVPKTKELYIPAFCGSQPETYYLFEDEIIIKFLKDSLIVTEVILNKVSFKDVSY